MLAAGTLIARGGDGGSGYGYEGGRLGHQGTPGYPGTTFNDACIEYDCSVGGSGGTGGTGGQGGDGGDGGDGGGGAGGTIKLAAYMINTSGARVIASGGTGGNPGASGRLILVQTWEMPFEGTTTDARVETYYGALPLSAMLVVSVNSVPDTGDGVLRYGELAYKAITQLIVTFSEEVFNPPGDSDPGDVTNPGNYALTRSDGVDFPVQSVSYENNGGAGPYEATLVLNEPLIEGHYTLTVNGSSSILDRFGLPLAGNGLTAGTDFNLVFSIYIPWPSTGFAPDRITNLRNRPEGEAYRHYDDLWLEIPSLGVEVAIVGVPLSADGWNVDWLGKNIGYLYGTAYPTHPGNTVLTAHVYDADGRPGPFVDLGRLSWGRQVIIHFEGQRYVYEVRSVDLWVAPTDTRLITKHEDYDWITLVTCRGFDETIDSYRWRTVVRAVLVSVGLES